MEKEPEDVEVIENDFRYIRPHGYLHRLAESESVNTAVKEIKLKKKKSEKVKQPPRDVIAGAKIRAFPEGLGPSERRNEWNFLKDQIGAIIRLKPSLKTQQQKLDFLVAEGGREIQKALNSKEAPDEIKQGSPIPVYDNALKRLDLHFHTGTNQVTDIIRFRNLVQNKTEPFIDFVHRLKQHASFCGFGEAEDNEIILQIRQTSINRDKLAEMMTRETKTLQEIINYGSCLDSEEATKFQKRDTVKEEEEQFKLADIAANFSHGSSFRGFRGGFRGGYRGRGNRGRQQRFAPYHDNRGSNITRRGFNENQVPRLKCYTCGKSGHVARNCYANTVSYAKEERSDRDLSQSDIKAEPYVWND